MKNGREQCVTVIQSTLASLVLARLTLHFHIQMRIVYHNAIIFPQFIMPKKSCQNLQLLLENRSGNIGSIITLAAVSQELFDIQKT